MPQNTKKSILYMKPKNNCFSIETKFWTSEGIRSFSDFEDGDEIQVKARNGWITGTVHNFGKQKLLKLTLYSNNNKKLVFYTTPTHRWIITDGKGIENFTTTSRLKYNEQLCCVDAKSKWTVKSVDTTDRYEDVWCIAEPKYEEFVIEGNILTKNCKIV